MKSPRSNVPPPPAGKSHEPGALGAYGAMIGALAAGGFGLLVDHWLFLGFVGGCVGWVAGLLIESARR